MQDVTALILAGGQGTRLSILAEERAKPAVPFGGIYRIVDFTLSNLMHSGIDRVGILTQYRPFSLMNHVGNGSHWDLNGIYRTARILPPYIGEDDHDWYRGTADAVYQNLNFVGKTKPREVLIVSGDHIYNMDFRAMVKFHRECAADVTVATLEVPWEEASRFGLMKCDDNNRVVDFVEKPKVPPTNRASMGIYLFSHQLLVDKLTSTIRAGGFDFGKNIFPDLVQSHKVCAFPFQGYWRDVGTIESYWQAHMDIFTPGSGLDLASWRVRTNLSYANVSERPPANIMASARVEQAVIGRGAVIQGEVVRSILAPGVRVAPGAVIRDSIVLHDAQIGEGTRINRSIVDKWVKIGSHTTIGEGEAVPNDPFPHLLSCGLSVVGEWVHIGNNTTVGTNVLVYPKLKLADGRSIPSGASVTQ